MNEEIRPDGSTICSWRSLDIPQRQRAGTLEMIMADVSPLPIGFSKRPHKDISARIRLTSFDRQLLMDYRCDPVERFRFHRSNDEIQRSRIPFLSVIQILEAPQEFGVGNGTLSLSPGDFFLSDSEETLHAAQDSPFAFRCLHFRKKFLLDVMPHAHDYVGQAISGKNGPGALFAAHMQVLARQLSSPANGDASSHQPRFAQDGRKMVTRTKDIFSDAMQVTGDLFAYAIGATAAVNGHAMRTIIFDRARQYILANLRRGDLTPSRVADALAISNRYLHQVFESYGTTVGTWIRRQRLERCRRDIQTVGLAGRTITEIAYSWGFNESSHFAKAFRREYGHSPSSVRELARLNGGVSDGD